MSPRLADPARSRIVLIGTPAHRRADDRLPDVPAVANNIADLAAVFTDPDLGGFDTGHCVTASAAIGLDDLGEVLTDAAEHATDLLLIYYAGHGLLDRRGQLHLALAGTHPDRLGFTALPYETLRAVCLDSDAASKVVILDSCFSGRAIGQTLAGDDQQVLGQLEVAGTYILTSAPANRTALILPGERHTAFTGRLLRLLRDGDPQSGPVLGIGEIYRQLRSRLQADGLPQPQQRGTGATDLLGLVRNRHPTPPTPVELPEEIRDGLDSRFPDVRLGAVNEPADRLTDPDPARALAARKALQHVADHDDPAVAADAATLLADMGTILDPEPATAVPGRPALTQTIDPVEARRLAVEAERVASTITIDGYSRALALAGVARAWAMVDPDQARRLAVEAERVASTVFERYLRALALAEVAGVWAMVDPDQARRRAIETERAAIPITEDYQNRRTAVRAEVARAWATVDPDHAERVADTITNYGHRVQALVEVVKAWATVDPDQARRLAVKAERVAVGTTTIGSTSKAVVLAVVARAWAPMDPDQARRLAAEAERVAGIFTGYYTHGALAQAEVVKAWATVDPDRARRLAAETERDLGTINYIDHRVEAMAEVVKAWATVDPDQARRLAAETERAADTISHMHINRKPRVLVNVVRAWASVDPIEAERVADTITRAKYKKAAAMTEVVKALATRTSPPAPSTQPTPK